MPSVTIRNLPDEVHRAIRVRAAQHGRSIEAEMRNILESAVKPQGRVKLGSMLASPLFGLCLLIAAACFWALVERRRRAV